MRRLSLLAAAIVAGLALVLGMSTGCATGRSDRTTTDADPSAAAPKPPGGDKLEGATLIGDLPATIRGSMQGVTRDAPDQDCIQADLVVWYRLRPSARGRFVVTLHASYGEVCVLAAGSRGLREVSEVLGEPDLGDPLSVGFDGNAGSEYYVVVGRVPDPGRFTLTVEAGTAFVPIWPNGIAVAPDGALWFTSDHGGATIGRITSAGRITRYTSPKIQSPTAIAVGPDGALWFTDSHAIGRITMNGTITTYTDRRLIHPLAITSGPNGFVWFTDYHEDLGEGGAIGRISAAGAIRLYTDARISAPEGITSGPDGAIWFTNAAGGSIGRISKTGSIRFFDDPRIVTPEAITAGADGALWFTSGETSSIGRITVNGALRTYRASSINWPVGITAGPDGALWFANFSGRSIGRISVSGAVRSYTDPSINRPAGITSGADGHLWFVDSGAIFRITASGVVSSFPPPATG